MNRNILITLFAISAVLTSCGNIESNVDPIDTESSSIAEVTTEATTTTAAAITSVSDVTTTQITTTENEKKSTTTTKVTKPKTTTSKKKTTTSKKKTTAAKKTTTSQSTQAPPETQATQPVYTEPVTQLPVTESPKPDTKATEKPVVTQAPEKKTSAETSKVTEKPKPAASTLTEGDEPPPGWHSDWVYKPTKGLDVTKSSVMKKYGLTDAEYEAYKDMVRGKTTKQQRLIVRQECIDFIMSKYPTAVLDENGYCFETEEGTPTCDALKAQYYGNCEFGAHGETSMVTPTYLLGGITQPYAVDWFIRDCHDGLIDLGIGSYKGVVFNVQVINYGTDVNLGIYNDSAVIGFTLGNISDAPLKYYNVFGKEVKATEQVY